MQFNQLLLFFFFFISSFLAAQISPLPNSISETWIDKVPVSGELRTGVMIGGACSDELKEYIYVNLPKHSYKYLVVQLVSKDGRYQGKYTYPIEGVSGMTKLNRESSKTTKLKSYKCSDLAILSWLSNEINGKKEEFVASSWISNPSLDWIDVYLNTKNEAFIYIKNKDSRERPIQCTALTGGSHAAFNCVCKIPGSKIKSDSKVTIINRIRKTQTKYPLPIRL